MNLYWHIADNISPLRLHDNLTMLSHLFPAEKLFISAASMEKKGDMVRAALSGVSVSAATDFLQFAAEHPAEDALRFDPYLNALPQVLVQELTEAHSRAGAEYSYCDGAVFGLRFSLEILRAGAAVMPERFFPDGSVAVSPEQKRYFHSPSLDVYRYFFGEKQAEYYSQPRSVNIEPASVCNLRCSMCWYNSDAFTQDWRTGKVEPYISMDMFKKVVDELKSLPEKVHLELCYRGEPLLHKDIATMVRYAAETGRISVHIVTNACLLDSSLSRELISAGLHAIHFSVDGLTPETYEAVRVGAEFLEVMDNIETFLQMNEENGGKVITNIKFVVSETNRHEKEQFLKHWVERVDYVVMQNLSIPYADGKLNYQAVTDVDVKRMPCGCLFSNILVATGGNILPCSKGFHEDDSVVMDAVSNSSVMDVWNGEKYRSARELTLAKQYGKIPYCAGCDGKTAQSIVYDKVLEGGIFTVKYPWIQVSSRISNRKLYPRYQGGV